MMLRAAAYRVIMSINKQIITEEQQDEVKTNLQLLQPGTTPRTVMARHAMSISAVSHHQHFAPENNNFSNLTLMTKTHHDEPQGTIGREEEGILARAAIDLLTDLITSVAPSLGRKYRRQRPGERKRWLEQRIAAPGILEDNQPTTPTSGNPAHRRYQRSKTGKCEVHHYGTTTPSGTGKRVDQQSGGNIVSISGTRYGQKQHSSVSASYAWPEKTQDQIGTYQTGMNSYAHCHSAAPRTWNCSVQTLDRGDKVPQNRVEQHGTIDHTRTAQEFLR